MSHLTTMINELNPVMTQNKTSSDRIESIITRHAAGAAATALGAGFMTFAFPAAGPLINVLVSTGIIWSMYYNISCELGIPMSKNLLKTLGSAFLSNIALNLGGVLLLELAATCIPFIGVAASAAICYAVTYLAGYLFIKLLVNVFEAGKRPDEMTADQLADISKDICADTNCKQIFKDAQADAKNRIDNGEITKKDTI